MNLKKKILTLSLLALLPIHIIFADSIDINENSLSTTSLESGVTMTKPSWFKVTIPKKIVLDGNASNQIYSQNYNVKVEGDLSGHETIAVIPDSNFTLTDKANLKSTTGSVSQTDEIFTLDSIGTLNKTTTGTVKVNNTGAGAYSGSFYFTINKTLTSEHNWGPWVVTTANTCTTDGIETATCTICNGTKTRVLSKKGHSYNTVVTPPTCTAQGYTTHTCSVCKHSYVDNYVAAKGHTSVTDAAKAATCTATGLTEGSHCSVCGTVLKAQTTIPAKGHTSVTDAAKAATCTATGLTEGSHCSVCRTVLKAQTTIPAKGHTNGTAVTENKKNATCTAKGSYDSVIYCTVCNAEVSRTTKEIAALGHSYESTQTVDKQATCMSTGQVSQHCVRYSSCKSATNIQTIAKKSHSYGDWYSTSSIDVCTQSGTMKRDCIYGCGTSETKSQSALGHSYTVSYYYCNTCNKHFSSIPTSHTNTSGSSCYGAIYAHKVCSRNSSHTTEAVAYTITNAKDDTDATFDIKAGSYGSTYSNSGYATYVIVNGSSQTQMTSNTYTSGSVKITRKVTVDSNNNANISYVVQNSGSSSATVSIAFCADTQVNGVDSAPCYTNSQGMYMTGNGITFQLYAFNTPGVTDMDTVWAGSYSSRTSNLWNSNSGCTGIDSGIAASWKNRTIPANTTLKFTCKMGLV